MTRQRPNLGATWEQNPLFCAQFGNAKLRKSMTGHGLENGLNHFHTVEVTGSSPVSPTMCFLEVSMFLSPCHIDPNLIASPAWLHYGIGRWHEIHQRISHGDDGAEGSSGRLDAVTADVENHAKQFNPAGEYHGPSNSGLFLRLKSL